MNSNSGSNIIRPRKYDKETPPCLDSKFFPQMKNSNVGTIKMSLQTE